jgi:hypothetical protein
VTEEEATAMPATTSPSSTSPPSTSPPSTSRQAATRLARTWDAVRFPTLCFGSVAVVLYATAALSIHLLPRHDEYPVTEPLSFRGAGLLEGWVRFDGGWYHSIITNGYFYKPGGQSSIAFFPGYPMLVGAVSKVTGDVYLAGVVTTFLCGLAMAVVFYRWCARKSSPQKAATALMLVLVFPYAWYLYGAMYADALFVLCAIGAFYLVEKDRPILAGLVAAVATATRPVGVAMVVGLVAVLLEHRGIIRIPWFERVREHGWMRSLRRDDGSGAGARGGDAGSDPAEDRAPVGVGASATSGAGAAPGRGPGHGPSVAPASAAGATGAAKAPRTRRILGIEVTLGRLRAADFGVLLSMGGLLGWMGYLWSSFGDPMLFIEVQSAPGWDQGQGPSTWFKEAWTDRLSHLYGHIKDGPATWTLMTYTLGVTFQAALVFTFLAMIPAVVKRIGWGYAVYVFTLIAIPVLGSKDWQGTGRYILGSFPVFLAIAGWMVDGQHVWVRRVWLAASAATLVFLTSAYARGYYLA